MEAVYSGSFDPFTNGHLDIVKQASEIFEEVHIIIANNRKKQRRDSDLFKMKNAIELTLVDENLSNCKVVIWDNLIADYCKINNINYIVRGLRNNMDYNYEENIAKINQEINPDLKTIYLRAKNDSISSSMVRELVFYDEDVSKYIPKRVLDTIYLLADL